MKPKNRHRANGGFTLMELLVSLGIFSLFLSIAITSYISLMHAEREANLLRKTYQELQSLLVTIGDAVRSHPIDYRHYSNQSLSGITDRIAVYDGANERTIVFQVVSTPEKPWKTVTVQRGDETSHPLLSPDVHLNDLQFFITPIFDPDLLAQSTNDTMQFQPSVTVRARFFDHQYLQTTVASRIYAF